MTPVRGRCIAVVAVFALALAGPAAAAAPRLIMAYGPSLPEPIVLVDYWDNLVFMTSVAEGQPVSREAVSGRPHIDLALFWGENRWDSYAQAGTLEDLRPDQANGHGRFYPAIAGSAPLVETVVDGALGVRALTSEGLAVLASNGIPIELDEDSDAASSSSVWPWVIGGFSALLLVAATAAAGLIIRGRSRGESRNPRSRL